MKYLKGLMTSITIALSVSATMAQLDITGQYRVKPEFRNGYQQPLLASELPSFHVSQRARLGANYTHKLFKFKLSLQDVRTWGNTSNIAIDDNGYLSVYEANVSLFFGKKWSVKMGRQPISYDNQRIFGELDWAMQGRRHDAALVKFRDNQWKVDVGLTYNNEKPTYSHPTYTLNNYKTFQYVWAEKKWTDFKASLLFLNNGMEYIYTVDSTEYGAIYYSQTFGTHLEYKKEKVELTGFGYYQTGFDQSKRGIIAYNASLEAAYKPSDKLKLSLGGEILSGTSQDPSADEYNRSFSPLYGTNHKFNGYMDYFYVGNHEKNVGLNDVYLKGKYKMNKFTFGLANHLFFANAAVINEDLFSPEPVQMDPFLGYEIDFTVKYQFADEVTIEAGYSHLFDTSTMREVKGTNNQTTSNWAYLMVVVKPFKNYQPFK